MNIRQTICRTASLIALAALSATPALAKDSGFYMGFAAGQTKFDLAPEDSGPTGLFTTVSSSYLDEKDMFMSLVGGYRIFPFLGVEAGLSEFGELTASETGFVGTASGIVDLVRSVTGPSLVLTGTLPLGNFEFSAKAGMLYAETKTIVRASAISGTLGQTLSGSAKSETTETMYGARVSYTFNEDFNVGIDWTMIPDVGDEDETGEIDMTILSLGFQYRF